MQRYRRIVSIYVFRPFRIHRSVLIGAFVVAAIVLVLAAPTILDRDNLPAEQRDTPWFVPVLFIAAMACAIAWNFYWYAVRMALEVTFDGERLQWRTGFSEGTCDIQDIIRVRTRMLMLIELVTDEGGIVLFPAKGVRGFVEAVARVRPDLQPIPLGIFVSNFERRVGRSRLTVHPRATQAPDS